LKVLRLVLRGSQSDPGRSTARTQGGPNQKADSDTHPGYLEKDLQWCKPKGGLRHSPGPKAVVRVIQKRLLVAS